jgi:hypothetical protein
MPCKRLTIALRPPHCSSIAQVGAKEQRPAEVYLDDAINVKFNVK